MRCRTPPPGPPCDPCSSPDPYGPYPCSAFSDDEDEDEDAGCAGDDELSDVEADGDDDDDGRHAIWILPPRRRGSANPSRPVPRPLARQPSLESYPSPRPLRSSSSVTWLADLAIPPTPDLTPSRPHCFPVPPFDITGRPPFDEIGEEDDESGLKSHWSSDSGDSDSDDDEAEDRTDGGASLVPPQSRWTELQQARKTGKLPESPSPVKIVRA